MTGHHFDYEALAGAEEQLTEKWWEKPGGIPNCPVLPFLVTPEKFCFACVVLNVLIGGPDEGMRR